MVLATNAIELGLQQAKMSPLPSVSDLLCDSGFDLPGDTGFGQPGYGPRSAAGAAPPGPGSDDGLPAAGGTGRRPLHRCADVRGEARYRWPAGHTITLLSRPGCHLCDEARTVIARVADDLGVAWSERDITGSQHDLRDYGDMIPVTLIDGVQHDFWRVDERRCGGHCPDSPARTAAGPGGGRPPFPREPAAGSGRAPADAAHSPKAW